MFKKILLLLVASFSLCLLSACSSSQETSINEPICDLTQFANISGETLVSLLGEPNEIEESTPANGFVEFPCTYYHYDDTEELGAVSFLLVNDHVERFTAYRDFDYGKGNGILDRFNLEKTKICTTIIDNGTALRYRTPFEGVDDVWISLIDKDNDTFGYLQITYDMCYFEEWYIPVSLNEKSEYQYKTQENVKSVLKSPSTAKFPNIGEWATVKNDYYIVNQSYVDAQNSFGATVRSDFTFYYHVDTGVLMYAIFDGEVICDNGYISTADLIVQKVTTE